MSMFTFRAGSPPDQPTTESPSHPATQPPNHLTTQPPSNVRYAVLGWVCALSMITYIDRVCIKQVAGDMRAELDIGERDFAWVFAAFGLAYALFEVPSGWLGDRLGPRRVLCRIVLCWSLF